MAFRRRRHRPRHGSARWRWPLIGLSAGGGVVAVALAVAIGQAAGNRACAAPGIPVVQAAAVRAAGAPAQEATHYVLQGLPNCSFSPPANGLYVALPGAEYASAARCGGYLEVSGPDASVRVKVIDQCPECAAGHIDLSEAAFAKLAPLSAGLLSVSYTSLANPVLPGPLSVEVKQGSSQYWLALLADNTGNPLASVQVQIASGWLSLARASYNYWIAQSGAGPGPFTVRLTDTQGHQVTVADIKLSPGRVQPTDAWMYGGGTNPAPSTPVTSRPAGPSTTGPSTAAPPSAGPSDPRPAPSHSPLLTPAAARTGVSLAARQGTQPVPPSSTGC
jgi:hypothetical protein